MGRQKITVEGLSIAIEQIREADYISITDIAKQSNDVAAKLISNWMKNGATLLYLEAWERTHNPNFKLPQMQEFKIESLDNRLSISPQRFIEQTGAIGLISKSGRYGGGTWAHKDIALNFCYWLSPPFQVYLIKEFQRLKEAESEQKNLKWHISKITNNIDEVRNLLDTIPFQEPERRRLPDGFWEDGAA